MKKLENDMTNFGRLQVAKLQERQKFLQSRISGPVKPDVSDAGLDKVLSDLDKLKSNERR